MVGYSVPWCGCIAVTVARHRCQAGPGTAIAVSLTCPAWDGAVLHSRTQCTCSTALHRGGAVHSAPGTLHCRAPGTAVPGASHHLAPGGTAAAGQSRSGDPCTTGHHRVPTRFEGPPHTLTPVLHYATCPPSCMGDLN